MHQQLVIANLKCKGTSLAAIAGELDLAYSTVYSVLAGQRSKRVEAAIADKLGLTVEQVFPNRYPENVIKQRMQTSSQPVSLLITELNNCSIHPLPISTTVEIGVRSQVGAMGGLRPRAA